MTHQALFTAYATWRGVHETIHGDLTVEEAQIVHELVEFLMACGQAEDPYHGEPFHAELVQDSQEERP